MRVPEEWSSRLATGGQNPAYRPSGSLLAPTSNGGSNDFPASQNKTRKPGNAARGQAKRRVTL